ncbi:MAG: HK97 family phage prohead protease [Clostridia bacterium]|nr:HK97 family phage prohead protease [Clostridia bacterium]
MPMKANREYRDMRLNIVTRAEDDQDSAEERMIVNGYASTFNEPYTLYEDDDIIFREQVDSSAFDNTDMSDVIMQYNHEGRVFARISNNTLRVQPDDQGLFIEADLGGTELGRQLFEEIAGGYTDKMSFGFIVDKDEELRTEAADGRVDILRTITSISKLFDVSAVSIPANDATSIAVRNLTDGVIEQIRAERLEAERIETERRRAIVKAKAIMSGGNK